jgi:hypothetical protein
MHIANAAAFATWLAILSTQQQWHSSRRCTCGLAQTRRQVIGSSCLMCTAAM